MILLRLISLPDARKHVLLAVDMTGDGGLRDYQVSGSQVDEVEDQLVFLAQPDSLIVSQDFAARNGLQVNDKIPMTTMDGEKAFTIRGIMSLNGVNHVTETLLHNCSCGLCRFGIWPGYNFRARPHHRSFGGGDSFGASATHSHGHEFLTPYYRQQ